MEPSERLLAYIKAANITKAEMARRCGYDAGNFHRVVHGNSRPSLPMAAAIERETGGLVKAVSWVERNTGDTK